MRLTIRESTLVHAAAEALYYLDQLQDENSFGEHLGGEQAAIEQLRKALHPYKGTVKMLTVSEAQALRWETP